MCKIASLTGRNAFIFGDQSTRRTWVTEASWSLRSRNEGLSSGWRAQHFFITSYTSFGQFLGFSNTIPRWTRSTTSVFFNRPYGIFPQVKISHTNTPKKGKRKVKGPVFLNVDSEFHTVGPDVRLAGEAGVVEDFGRSPLDWEFGPSGRSVLVIEDVASQPKVRYLHHVLRPYEAVSRGKVPVDVVVPFQISHPLAHLKWGQREGLVNKDEIMTGVVLLLTCLSAHVQ